MWKKMYLLVILWPVTTGLFPAMLLASQTCTEFRLNKGSKAARPPKTFMSKNMDGQSSQLVSCSSVFCILSVTLITAS